MHVESNTRSNSFFQCVTDAMSLQALLTGMNQFLSSLEITFRRDPTNYRPRINK